MKPTQDSSRAAFRIREHKRKDDVHKDSGEGEQEVKTFTLNIFHEHVIWYKIRCQIYSKIGGASTSTLECLSSQGRTVISRMGIGTRGTKVCTPTSSLTGGVVAFANTQVGPPKSHSLICIMETSPATTPEGWGCENWLRICMYST